MNYALLDKLCCLVKKDLFTLNVFKLDFVFFQFQYKTLQDALTMFCIMLLLDLKKENGKNLFQPSNKVSNHERKVVFVF